MTAAEGKARLTAELIDEQMPIIRREFFKSATDKQFFQELNMLRQAISYPARWLDDRGAALPRAEYRKILQTVIDTIKRHGNRAKIKRFSAYFLHAVQHHMIHHGEEYYQVAKNLSAGRSLSSLLPKAIGRIEPSQTSDQTVQILAELHRSLKSKGGRKKSTSDYVRYGSLDLFGIQSAEPPSTSS